MELIFDEIANAATAKEKVALIKEWYAFGPVVTTALMLSTKNLKLPLLVVDRRVNHAALECLDHDFIYKWSLEGAPDVVLHQVAYLP